MMQLGEVREIRLDEIRISEYQARKREIEKGIEDLVENMRVHGQLAPIVVASLNSGGPPYEVLLGQRRYLAYNRLCKNTILAIVLPKGIDPYTARALSVSENLIRQDLNELDLIDACTALYQKYGSVKSVSQELGLPYHKVRSFVKYERLNNDLKAAVRDGTLDIQGALLIQDYADDHPDDGRADVAALAREMTGMTRAEQNHFLKTHEPGRGEPSNEKARQGRARKLVKQVLITLSDENHYRLRMWAREERISSLDKAGAKILTEFLSSL